MAAYRGAGTFQPTIKNAAGGQFAFLNPMAAAGKQPAYGKLPAWVRPTKLQTLVPSLVAAPVAAPLSILGTSEVEALPPSPTVLPLPVLENLKVVNPLRAATAATAARANTVLNLPPTVSSVNNSLPPGWTEQMSQRKGKPFYWRSDPITGKVIKRWNKPTMADVNPPPVAPVEKWLSTVNKSTGDEYFYNPVTRETRWTKPGSSPKVVAEQAQVAASVAVAAAANAAAANGLTKKELKKVLNDTGVPTAGKTKKELVTAVQQQAVPAAAQAAVAATTAASVAIAAAGGGAAGGGAGLALPVPVPGGNRSDYETLARLTDLLRQYEIRPDFLQRALQLEEYEIALILDNSGSMNATSDAPIPSGWPENLYWTRWEELKHIAKILIPIANIFDRNGVDIYLFDKVINNYTDTANFNDVVGTPYTSTPLTKTLNQVLTDKAEMPPGKKLLIFIITDGQPDDGVSSFKQALLKKRENVYVSILACNSDESAIGYLNDIDNTVPRVDCVDDYKSERKEVLDVQGSAFPFSYGDYIIKALLGAVDPVFDNLDEMNLLTGEYIVKSDQHHSVARGKTSLTMLSDVRTKWKIGTPLLLKTFNLFTRGPPNIDRVTVTSISANGKTVGFTPALQHDHFNYQTECMPGAAGCLPRFWGGRTRRHSPKSKTRRNKNKYRKTRHKSR